MENDIETMQPSNEFLRNLAHYEGQCQESFFEFAKCEQMCCAQYGQVDIGVFESEG